MSDYNLQDLAEALNGQAVGDVALQVTGACEPQDAAGSLMAIATSQSYVERLPLGQARVASWQREQIGKPSSFRARFLCRDHASPWQVLHRLWIAGGDRVGLKFILRPVWTLGHRLAPARGSARFAISLRGWSWARMLGSAAM